MTSDSLDILKNEIETTIRRPCINWEFLLTLLKVREYKRDEFIVKAGKGFRFEIFLVDGIFRSFLKDMDGNEINLGFYRSGQIVSPYFIRNINGEHLYYFQCITTCRALLFSAIEFNKLIREYPDIRDYAFKVVENELRHRSIKEKYFINGSATEKLNFFRSTYPGLENQIPLHHVASYLGISQVSLSRLRSNRQ